MNTRTRVLLLAVCTASCSTMCFAQVAPVSKLQTTNGFLEVCGRTDLQLSKEQVETMRKNAQAGQPMDAFKQAMNDSLTEQAMCLGYVAGLIQGWKEGHEHGVTAAQFPDGWPQDEEKAIKALPLRQLDSASAAMKVDVPCIPDYVTIGQERDIILKRKYVLYAKVTRTLLRCPITALLRPACGWFLFL